MTQLISHHLKPHAWVLSFVLPFFFLIIECMGASNS